MKTITADTTINTTNNTITTPIDSSTELSDKEVARIKEILGINVLSDMVNAIEASQTNMGIYVNQLKEQLTSGFALQAEAIKSGLDSMMDKICETISAEEKTNRSQRYAINAKATTPTNPLFYSTYDVGKQNLWKEKSAGIIAEKCLEENQNKGTMHNLIYKYMKEKDGYNLDLLLKEFRTSTNNSNATYLDMCAASDALRLSFEKNVNNLYHKESVRRNKTNNAGKSSRKKITYTQAKRCPAEIYAIVSAMANNGNPRGTTFNKAAKILAANNVDVNKLKDKVIKKYGIKDCSIWFALSHYPAAVEVLRNAVANKGA